MTDAIAFVVALIVAGGGGEHDGEETDLSQAFESADGPRPPSPDEWPEPAK